MTLFLEIHPVCSGISSVSDYYAQRRAVMDRYHEKKKEIIEIKDKKLNIHKNNNMINGIATNHNNIIGDVFKENVTVAVRLGTEDPNSILSKITTEKPVTKKVKF